MVGKENPIYIPIKSPDETGPGIRGLDRLSKSLNKLQKTWYQLKEPMDKISKTYGKVAGEISKFEDAAMKHSQKMAIAQKKAGDAINQHFKKPYESTNNLIKKGFKDYDRNTKSLTGMEAVSKKLGISMYSTEKMFKQAGISTKSLGFDYQNMNQLQKGMGSNVERLGGQFKTFGSVMQMDTDAFQGFTKAGYKFAGTGPKMAAGFRVATAGLRGFKMEFLSIMFFGMQMQSIGMGMLGPAMQMFGITDMWTVMLQTVMVPIMQILQPILMKFMMWFIEAPEGIKLAIGAIVVLITVIGFLMFAGAQIGLLFGAIPGKIGVFATGVGKIVGGMHGMFAKLFLRLKVMFLMRGVNASNKKGLGTLFSTTDKTGKKVTKSWGKSMKGMMVGTSTGVKGIIAAMGPIGIALAVVAAAIALFAVAWSGNWYGIRQKTGEFVKWFSGIYDTYMKPYYLQMGTGLIILKNVFFFALNNILSWWTFIWLNMESTAYGIWNGLISGVEWFVNAMLYPFIELSKIGGGLVKDIFGFDMPTLGKIDLGKFKIDTKEVDKNLKKVGDELKTNLVDMSKDTVREVEGLSDTLDGLTGFIDESGDAMIESGNKFDAESAKKGKNKSITDSLKDSIGGLNSGIKDTFPSMDIYNTKIYDNDKAIEDATKGLGDMSDTVNTDWAEAMNFQSTKLGDVSGSFDDATGSVNSYINSLKRIPSGGGSSGGYVSPPSIEDKISDARAAMDRHLDLIHGRIPKFQNGGIFTKPTLGIIGEAGPEAVVPLGKSGMGTTIHVHNTYNISGVSSKEDIERMIDESNTKLVDDLKSMLR